jgi:pyruvate dehydrogenase E2 component (dihydrolipoamide acetyltransferase)
MPVEITMPRLSDTMEEGTLVKWRVKVGDKVSPGDHLADVETDKATMELQTFDDGTVAKLAVDEGATVAVGKLILVLAEAGESVEDAARAVGDGGGSGGDKPEKKAEKKPEAASAKASSEGARDEDDERESSGASSSSGGGRQKVSPLARKLAEEHGVDLSSIEGSGPDGRIIKRDVLAAAEGGGKRDAASAGSPKAQPAPPATRITAPSTLESKREPVTNMRKTIAKRLVESKTQVPHFQVATSVNVDPLIELRKTINAQLETQGVKLSVNDFVTRATALACLHHPVINASWTTDAIQYHGSVNVGTAIALPAEKGGGLVVATIRDVQNKGLRQISQEIKALANKAKTRGLSPDEMSDSTITISNLGAPAFGKVTQFTAIINPPNAAILAIGAAIQQPVVRDGELGIGHEMSITLSGDHRVIDGATAAEYLVTLKGLLENPAAILV